MSLSAPSVRGSVSAISAQYAFWQSGERFYAFFEAFLEVYFTAHCFFGDGAYHVSGACAFGQFVYNFDLYQGGVHVETYQAAVSVVHVVFLESYIYPDPG